MGVIGVTPITGERAARHEWHNPSETMMETAAGDDSLAFDEGRKPLAEAKMASGPLPGLRSSIERFQSELWVNARNRLRQDPHAALPEFAAPLSDP